MRSPTATMDRPLNGSSPGSELLISRSVRLMRLVGIFAARSDPSVRSTIKSWKEKASLPDFPAFLEGLIWPARINVRTCEAGMPNRRFRSFESNSCISSARRLPGGRGCRGALRRLAFLETRCLRAARIDAGPQRFHQIDDVAAGGGGRCFGERDLLALDFFLNRGLDASLELVVILVRVEALRCQMVDELLRELELGLGNGSGLQP